MAKYIDVEKLQFEPDPWGGMNGVLITGRSSGKVLAMVKAALKKMIENTPAENVAPVVRCDACRNWTRQTTNDKRGYCDCLPYHLCQDEVMTDHDFYCPYGERRK